MSTTKVYRGSPPGAVWIEGGSGFPLSPRHDLRNHSPSGFSWGFGGSGPAQLALALLCDALGDEARAQRLYQQFKWEHISSLPIDGAWTMAAEDIRVWADQAEEEPQRGAQ